MSRSHILFEFALLTTNGQLHSLSPKTVQAANLWLCESFQRLQFCTATSRGLAGSGRAVHPSCWACLPASNSFSFMEARALLVRAEIETAVVGLQDAVDKFFYEAVQDADALGDNRSGADESVE